MGLAALLAPLIGPTLAGVAAPALEGAAGGALLGGITGGNPLTGALTGGLTGGGIGLGGEFLGPEIGTVGGEALGGAAAGALGAGVTGGNPLIGGLEGGAAGGLAGLIGPSGTSAGSASAPAGASAAGGAPATGVGHSNIPADITSGNFGNIGSDIGASNLNPANWNIFGGTPAAPVPGVSSANLAPPGFDVTPTSAAELNSANPAATALAQQGVGGGVSGDVANVLGLNTGNGGGAGQGSFLSKLTNNPSALVAAGGLGLNMLKNNNVQGLSNLNNQEQQLFNEAQSLAAGNLPPAIAAAQNQNLQGQIAAIRGQYAAMGLTGSTQELQAIQQAQNASLAQAAQYVQTGLQASGLSQETLANIVKINTSQNQATGQAIANLSAALGGSQIKQPQGQPNA